MNEFLESDSNLHVMRDHPAHGAFVMGGLWGAKVVNMRKDLILAFKDMFAVRTLNIALKLLHLLTPPVSGWRVIFQEREWLWVRSAHTHTLHLALGKASSYGS